MSGSFALSPSDRLELRPFEDRPAGRVSRSDDDEVEEEEGRAPLRLLLLVEADAVWIWLAVLLELL